MPVGAIFLLYDGFQLIIKSGIRVSDRTDLSLLIGQAIVTEDIHVLSKTDKDSDTIYGNGAEGKQDCLRLFNQLTTLRRGQGPQFSYDGGRLIIRL